MFSFLASLSFHVKTLLCPARKKGGIKRCFCPSVRPTASPSVRLSVAYIANNWRTRRFSVPKFGMNVPHFWCDWRTSFKVKKVSKIKVTRPINADTHRAPYILNIKAYELQTWCTDGGRRPASADWPSAVPVSLEAGGGIPCRPNRAATILVSTSSLVMITSPRRQQLRCCFWWHVFFCLWACFNLSVNEETIKVPVWSFLDRSGMVLGLCH